jgi:hypothetical protein
MPGRWKGHWQSFDASCVPPSRKPHILYAGLALLFLASATYRVLDIAERVGDLRHGGEYVREPFDIDLPEYTLADVEEEAARAGLKRGDRISHIMAAADSFVAGAPQHDDMTLVVARCHESH